MMANNLSLPLSNSAKICINLTDEPVRYENPNAIYSTIPHAPHAKGPVTVNNPVLSTTLPREPIKRSDSNTSSNSLEFHSSLVLFDPNTSSQTAVNVNPPYGQQDAGDGYPGYTQVEVHPPPPPPPDLPTESWQQQQQPKAMFKKGVMIRAGSSSPSLQRSNSNNTSDPPSPTSPGTLISELRSKLRTTSDDADSVLMSSLDDSRSVTSYSTQSSGGNEADSACSVEGSDGGLANDRVAIATEGDVALMVLMRCESESTLENERFQDAAVDVARVCIHYYLRQESERGTMNGTQINVLVMPDQRPVKEYLERVSQELNDNLTAVKAVAQKVTTKLFVGTFVNEPVRTKDEVTVGKSGVIITLKKMNKISPACEFSDQLCHHIVYNRPEALGKPEKPRPERVSRKEKAKRPVDSGRCLLSQSFLYDPTITVTEAARRSFVEIADFFLLG